MHKELGPRGVFLGCAHATYYQSLQKKEGMRPSLNYVITETCRGERDREVFSSIHPDPLEGIKISFPRFSWTWTLNIWANGPMRIEKSSEASSDMLFLPTNNSKAVFDSMLFFYLCLILFLSM